MIVDDPFVQLKLLQSLSAEQVLCGGSSDHRIDAGSAARQLTTFFNDCTNHHWRIGATCSVDEGFHLISLELGQGVNVFKTVFSDARYLVVISEANGILQEGWKAHLNKNPV